MVQGAGGLVKVAQLVLTNGVTVNVILLDGRVIVATAQTLAAVGISGAMAARLGNDSGRLRQAFSEIVDPPNSGSAQGGGSAPNNPTPPTPPFRTGKFGQGSYGSAEESLREHFAKHGAEVGATDIGQYLRKAEGFAQNLRGATKSPVQGATPGVTRYKKLGKYIDLDADGNIISFGSQRLTRGINGWNY